MNHPRAILTFLLASSLFSFSQWKKLDSGTDASLRGVSAPTAEVCWASGSKGTVLRTTDGGKTWTKLPVTGGDSLDFRDIEAWDKNTAVIMSAGPAEKGQAKTFRTTNGGKTWKETFSTDRKGAFLDSMAFWDKKRGVMFSDPVDGKFPIFTTNDGGASWTELKPESMPDALKDEGAFAASGTAIAVAGENDIWFGTGGASVARVFHSSDGGKHWTTAEVPIAAGKPSAGVFGVAFRDVNHGVAVGGDYLMKEGEVVAAAWTEDGGRTWKANPSNLPPLQGVVAQKFAFVAIGNAFVLGVERKVPRVDTKIQGNAIASGTTDHKVVRVVVGSKGSIYLEVGSDIISEPWGRRD